MTTERITETDETTPAAITPELSVVDASETPTDAPEEQASDIDLALLEATLDYIRPALQADGGDMVLLGVEDGVVTLQLVGACGGCPMSMMTLRAGIERILIDRVPGIREVVAL